MSLSSSMPILSRTGMSIQALVAGARRSSGRVAGFAFLAASGLWSPASSFFGSAGGPIALVLLLMLELLDWNLPNAHLPAFR